MTSWRVYGSYKMIGGISVVLHLGPVVGVAVVHLLHRQPAPAAVTWNKELMINETVVAVLLSVFPPDTVSAGHMCQNWHLLKDKTGFVEMRCPDNHQDNCYQTKLIYGAIKVSDKTGNTIDTIQRTKLVLWAKYQNWFCERNIKTDLVSKILKLLCEGNIKIGPALCGWVICPWRTIIHNIWKPRKELIEKIYKMFRILFLREAVEVRTWFFLGFFPRKKWFDYV